MPMQQLKMVGRAAEAERDGGLSRMIVSEVRVDGTRWKRKRGQGWREEEGEGEHAARLDGACRDRAGTDHQHQRLVGRAMGMGVGVGVGVLQHVATLQILILNPERVGLPWALGAAVAVDYRGLGLGPRLVTTRGDHDHDHVRGVTKGRRRKRKRPEEAMGSRKVGVARRHQEQQQKRESQPLRNLFPQRSLVTCSASGSRPCSTEQTRRRCSRRIPIPWQKKP